MAFTPYTVQKPKVKETNWDKPDLMDKGGDLTKFPTTKPVKKPVPTMTTAPKAKAPAPVNIGASQPPTRTFTAPPSYETALTMYRDLAGAKDPESLRKRRDIASWLSKNKPGAVTTTTAPTGTTGAVTTTTAPTGTTGGVTTGAEVASTFNPADYEGDLVAPEMSDTTPPLIDPAIWQQMLANLSKSGEWASNVRLPTEQELADLYAKNYEQQLADLSYGVQGKQTQAQKQREQYLADRGISPDSAAYRNEQQSLAEQRAFEDAQLRTQARGFAQQQADSQFNRAYQTSAAEMEKARLEQDLKYRGLEALTPLATTQAQIRSQEYLTKFNANTQVMLERARLNQSDRQFFAGLDQDQSQHFDNIIQQEKDRSQNAEQFEKNSKIAINQFKQEMKQRKKEFYESVRATKVLEDSDRQKLAELVRSNKRGEALQLLAIKKQGASGKEAEDLDALANRIRTIGAATIDVELQRREAGLDPAPQTGIDYGF